MVFGVNLYHCALSPYVYWNVIQCLTERINLLHQNTTRAFLELNYIILQTLLGCVRSFCVHTLHWSHLYRMSLYFKLAAPARSFWLWFIVWSLNTYFFKYMLEHQIYAFHWAIRHISELPVKTFVLHLSVPLNSKYTKSCTFLSK